MTNRTELTHQMSPKCRYYFNYDDGVSGSCDTDRSYVKPCVGHRRLEMHFEHCSASAQLNGQDAQLECLATWKDGSDTYMYGRFTGRRLLNKEETYRCFQYELYGSDVYMAMSADASCRGLRSSRAGPLILQLRQDVNGWPKPSCRFPEWLVSFSWRDMADKQLFNSSSSSQTFVGFNRRKSGAKLRRRSEYRCIETLRHVTEDGLYTVLAFSTHECTSVYKFRRLADGALKFKQGKLMDMDRATRCLQENQYESVHILTDDKLKSGHCPRSGIYTATSQTSCFSYADVGCHQRDVIVIHSTCPETPSLTFQCSLSHWRHDNDTYVIVTKLENNSTATSCIRVRRRGEKTDLSIDSSCSVGVSHAQYSDTILSLLRGTRERCPGSQFDTSDDTTVGKESDSKKSNSDDVDVVVGDNGIASDKIRTKEVRTASPSGDHIIKHRPDETVDSTAGGAPDRNYFDNGYENADSDVNSNRRTSIVIDVTSGAGARAPVALGPVIVVAMWLCRVLAN
ncbi:hypothetical protein NP493_124g02009 [Ridgeia piscesae]|uniref:DUF7042 domain-containing protein n=1 Tax=Ridgeia piscesae TaxID=27915 RepID=A0AAD9P630_RIDPI|nr:hypothetical protein NP493_124g02009 [Ridgeia piscesae]